MLRVSDDTAVVSRPDGESNCRSRPSSHAVRRRRRCPDVPARATLVFLALGWVIGLLSAATLIALEFRTLGGIQELTGPRSYGAVAGNGSVATFDGRTGAVRGERRQRDLRR